MTCGDWVLWGLGDPGAKGEKEGKCD
jgi:hypothetical protein